MLLHTRPCGLTFRPTSATSRQARQVTAAAAKKQKPQKKKLRKPKQPVQQRIYMDYELDEDEEDEQGGMVQSVLLPGVAVPSAPAPASGPRERPLEPEELYPVFPKTQQPSVTALPPGKWNWGEAGNPAAAAAGQAQQQDTPMWNPKTGFMKTREQIEQEAAAAAAAAAAPPSGQPGASSQQSSSSSSSSSSSRFVEPLPPAAPAWQQQQQQQQPQQQPATAPQPAAAAAAADLPAVSREAVLGSCAKTSAAMLVGAAILHVFAQRYAPSLFATDPAAVQQLLRVPAGLSSASEAGWLLGAAGAVTAARLLLLQVWGDFADATERSNKQVLSPLSLPDVVLVALLTGVSEEFLFRGGLVPLTWPDYRGALLSGVVFGVLHVGGGRNAAFAAWATAVGWLYGGVFLACGGNVWVPAGAHALANFASAAVWMSKNGGGSSGSEAKQGAGQDTK